MDILLICDMPPEKWLLRVPALLAPDQVACLRQATEEWLKSPASRLLVIEEGMQLLPFDLGPRTIGAEFCAA